MIIVSKIHTIVNDTSDTVSSIGITPSGNFPNRFTNEIIEKFAEKSGKNHVIMKNPIVIVAAIIWFSVKLDANIPNDIYAIDNNINPTRVSIVAGIAGSP